MAGIAEKVLMSRRREVEEKGLKLSIREGMEEQGGCVVQQSGREISGMQHQKEWVSKPALKHQERT